MSHMFASSAASLSSSGAASPATSDTSVTSIIPIVAPSYAYSSRAPGTISFFESVAPLSDEQQDTDERNGGTRKKARKKRAGWGPFRSVLNERSVDFNLTLDVQNLKQEIQTMEMMRDILVSKTLIQRHDPEGSLVRTVQEHYRIMRSGFRKRESGRKRRAINEQDQKEWIRSIFDPNVDVGNGAIGVHRLIEQIELYSVFINFISNTMTHFEVIVTEDSVLVATTGILHFQILRNTIAGMFPHVLGEEWLVSKLVGQEIRADSTMDFYFDATGKVTTFHVNLDYVKTFLGILKDPRDVAILLGQALITDNCMIGLTNDDLSPPPPRSQLPVDGTSPDEADVDAFEDGDAIDDDAPHPVLSTGVSQPLPSSDTDSSRDVRQSAICEPSRKTLQPVSSSPAAVSTMPMSGPLTPSEHCSCVVQQYFAAFTTGADSAAAVSDAQRRFLVEHVVPQVGYGSVVGRAVLEDRWRSLFWCFGALRFRQLSQASLAHTPMENLYRIQSTAEYSMRVTVRTVEQVFPHVFADVALMDILVGATLCVPARLTFWFDKDTDLVTSITEQMDFDSALRRVVANADDLAFVLTRARPTLYGFVGEVVEPSAADDDAASIAEEADELAATAAALRVRAAAMRAHYDRSKSRRAAVPTSPASPSFSGSFVDVNAPSSSEAKMRLANILD